MEIILSGIIIYLIIHLYFCRRDLLKPILFCIFSAMVSIILFQMGKPELGIIYLSINVFITGLLILISLHFSKYNQDIEKNRGTYKLTLSLIGLAVLFGVFIVEIDRNYESFSLSGNQKVLSTLLLESSIISNSQSIILIPLIMLMSSIGLVFMFRKERIK